MKRSSSTVTFDMSSLMKNYEDELKKSGSLSGWSIGGAPSNASTPASSPNIPHKTIRLTPEKHAVGNLSDIDDAANKLSSVSLEEDENYLKALFPSADSSPNSSFSQMLLFSSSRESIPEASVEQPPIPFRQSTPWPIANPKHRKRAAKKRGNKSQFS